MTTSKACYDCGATNHELAEDGQRLYECEDCGNWFCSNHGQRGGDRQVQDVGAVAYPSLCELCCGRRY